MVGSRSSPLSRPDQADHGLAHGASWYSVPEMLGRLETLAKSRGLTIFPRIDFSGLMIASPSIAIDLPLKALAWEDVDGKVWLSYNTPEYLKERHGVPTELLKNISAIGALVEEAVK